MRSRRDILLRLKNRSMKESRSLISVPPFTSILPLHQAVFAKLIQSFTVSKHLWVRYYNNSSNIIFMLGEAKLATRFLISFHRIRFNFEFNL